MATIARPGTEVTPATTRPNVASANVQLPGVRDYEQVDNNDYAPSRPDERRWAVHMLINF